MFLPFGLLVDLVRALPIKSLRHVAVVTENLEPGWVTLLPEPRVNPQSAFNLLAVFTAPAMDVIDSQEF
jgi:hypothetical protein